MKDYQEKMTTIFLLDQYFPNEIVLLKRDKNKKFAPNYYTGLGGKIEENETPFECAFRELKEETGIYNVELKEFAQVIVNSVKILHYFAGIYKNKNLPSCNEGVVEWYDINKALKKKIIPTTLCFYKEWQKRSWDIKKPFTIFLTRENAHDIESKNLQIIIKEGLCG